MTGVQTCALPIFIFRTYLAGIGQAGLLFHRKRIELGAQHDRRSRAVFQNRDDSRAGDVFGSDACSCGAMLRESMRRITQEGAGVVVYLHQSGWGEKKHTPMPDGSPRPPIRSFTQAW
mgnify:CR=1 FL=1